MTSPKLIASLERANVIRYQGITTNRFKRTWTYSCEICHVDLDRGRVVSHMRRHHGDLIMESMAV